MITETVLEMHFHRPLMDLFRDHAGIGGQGELQFFKYSTQVEAFVGFDQAYVQTSLSEAEFLNMLRHAASQPHPSIGRTFLGYFLQFKVVQEMQNRNKYTPPSIRFGRHLRVPLSTKKNIRTGTSQHELLYNLSRNAGALVYYACPMLFSRDQLYELNVDLDRLRLADLATCPSDYQDNDNHFIYFGSETATPFWCSEPVEGKAGSPGDFANRISDILRSIQPAESARALLQLLTIGAQPALRAPSEAFPTDEGLRVLSLVEESLGIISFTPKAERRARNGTERPPVK